MEFSSFELKNPDGYSTEKMNLVRLNDGISKYVDLESLSVISSQVIAQSRIKGLEKESNRRRNVSAKR